VLHKTRAVALASERAEIREYDPLCNGTHKRRGTWRWVTDVGPVQQQFALVR